MTTATVRSLLFFARPGQFVITFRGLVRICIALLLVLALQSSIAFAQNDLQVHIVPRAHFVAAQSPPDAGAQQSPLPTQSQQMPASQSPAAPQPSQLLVPPGTTLPLGLLRPLSLRSSSARGKGIYLQITFPVVVGGRMIIPPGAYLQATIEKITRQSGDPDLEFELSNASLIFSNGYTVPVAGAVKLMHTTVRLQPPSTPNSQEQPAALSAAAGSQAPSPAPTMSAVGVTPPDLPPLPKPSFGNGPRNIMIAMGVIAGVGIIAGLAVALHHRNDIYLDTGTPLEIILSAPLLMDTDSVNAAVHQYSAQMAVAPIEIVRLPERPRMCVDPGSPGSPDTVIPGSPPTPPTVIPGVNGMPDTVIPGSPGTPDTVIPGTPGTPSSTYPCPKR